MTSKNNLDVCLCGWEKTKLVACASSFSRSWICKHNHDMHWVGPCCLKDGKCTYHSTSNVTSTGLLWASQVALRKYIPIQSCFSGYIPRNLSYSDHILAVLNGKIKISLLVEGMGTFSNTSAFFTELQNRKFIAVSGSPVHVITGIRSMVYLYDKELNGVWSIKISHKGIPTILTHILFAPVTQTHAVYTIKINISPTISTEFCFSASPCTHPGKKECIKQVNYSDLIPGHQLSWTLHRNAMIRT